MLNNVWTQIVGQVEDKAKREFEEILVEKDVVGGLNELERLVGTAKARKEAGGEGMLPNEPSVYLYPSPPIVRSGRSLRMRNYRMSVRA